MSSLAARFALCFSLAIGAVAPQPASAGGLRDHAESLHAVPADAAFYGASLKYGEQLEALLDSGAWKKLMTIPGIQLGLMQAQAQWQFPSNPQVQQAKELVESEIGQQVLALAKELAADEVFVYGDSAWTTLIEVAVEINSEVSQAPFRAMQQGLDGGLDEGLDEGSDADEAVQLALQQKLTELLEQRGGELRVPDLVLGFRVKDRELALSLLSLLEEPLRAGLEQASLELADKLRRDGELLTMTFEADDLPWDKIESEVDEAPELIAAARQFLQGKRAVVAIGMVEDFVVVSLGDSTAHLTAAADGPLLADREEFERLSAHADERVTSIGYVSGGFLRAANSNEKSFEDLATMGKGLAAQAGLDPDRRAAIESDIDELKQEVLDYLPEPGAIAGVTFMTDRGYESYSYNWGGVAPNLDASKPLTLIGHLGAESLGWFTARSKPSIEDYDKVASWLRRGRAHFEAIAEPSAEPDEWAKYTEIRDWLLPLLSQLHDANRELLFPAMADGQGGLVVDAQAADAAWCEFMPEAGSELPLPTLALVYSVSDAEKLKQAAAVYWDVAQQIYDEVQRRNADELPAIKLEAPAPTATDAGELFVYELPAEWGSSSRVAPNAALSESTLVLSLLPELSERLLAGDAPAIDGPAAEFDRPLLSAAHFDFAQVLDLVRPWIDYGIQFGVEQAEENEQAAQAVAMVGFVKPQVEQLLDVLQAIDSWTGATYRESDAWVTHGELRIIDLED